MSFLTRRSLALVTARLGLALSALCAPVVLLALVASRALPGGGAIGFLSSRDGNSDIYVLDIARGTLHNLTDNGAANGSFTFSPDGTRIAFESNKDGNTEIYMMSMECVGIYSSCGGIVQLTDAKTDSRNPVWSPDGRHIAYVYDVSFSDADNEIYVMDVELMERRNISSHPENDNSPAWSPDGARIVFISFRDIDIGENRDSEVYIGDIEGGFIHQLTNNDSLDYSPIWSLDGNSILFVTSVPPEFIPEVALMDITTNKIEQVVPQSVLGLWHGQSGWIPNTNQLVTLLIEEDNTEIAIVDLDTYEIIQVTNDYFTNQTISLSSDRRLIAYDSFDYNSVSEIYIAEIMSSIPPRLLFSSAASPVWWPEHTS